jgi:hypothetical protein
MVSFAAMSKYCMDITNGNPNLICNADGTAFTVGYNIKGQRKCKVIVKKDKNKSYKARPDKKQKYQGLLTKKMYFFIFASGLNGPLIFIIENNAFLKNLSLLIEQIMDMSYLFKTEP